MNKMIIDDVEYELILHGQGCTDVPSVMCDGKAYIGQAIPNKRKKDYEILHFKAKEGPEFALGRNDDGTFGPYSVKEDLVLTWPAYEIKAVRRLSDGEVFLLGDKTEDGIIKEFQKTFDNRIIITFKGSGMPCYLDATVPLRKLNRKLFITEDGVDIYEGVCTTIYVVNTSWQLFDVTPTKAYGWVQNERDDFKYFSSKELAYQFLIMNKPCLSVNDVIKYNGTLLTDRQKSVLIELAKEKINVK